MLRKITISFAHDPDQAILPFLSRAKTRQTIARHVRAHLKTLYPKLKPCTVYYRVDFDAAVYTIKIK